MATMFWLLAILAYLLGSLSFAILLSRLAGGPDPRAERLADPGATNMLRVAGKKLAVMTLIGDLVKGLLPVLLAKLLGQPAAEQAWIGLAAVLGHLYPLYFHFRGGKGVATRRRAAAGPLLAGRAAGAGRLAAGLRPDPYQFAGGAQRHAADAAAAGLATAGAALASSACCPC